MCYVVRLSSLSKVKKFLFFPPSRKGERGCVFAVFFSPVPEKKILDFIAHGSIIQVFTVDSFGALFPHKLTGRLSGNRKHQAPSPICKYVTYHNVSHLRTLLPKIDSMLYSRTRPATKITGKMACAL